MTEYIFTRDHALDGVKYKAGEVLVNNRNYNVPWLMQQGVPLQAVGDAVTVTSAPQPAPAAPVKRTRPALPRFKSCCGWSK